MASASAAFWFSLAGVRSVCGSSRTGWRELSFPLTLALHSVGCPWSSRAHGVRRRAISRLSRLPSMLTCSGVSGDCGAASIEARGHFKKSLGAVLAGNMIFEVKALRATTMDARAELEGLDSTLLNDRQTTLRAYCAQNPHILEALSAEDLDADAPTLRSHTITTLPLPCFLWSHRSAACVC